jgi:hypothetical protein
MPNRAGQSLTNRNYTKLPMFPSTKIPHSGADVANLALVMHTFFGLGTPRGLQGLVSDVFAMYMKLIRGQRNL